MKTAITIWNGRVAPVFDVSQKALVLEQDNGRCISEDTIVLPGGSALENIIFLERSGIEYIVCGAISQSGRLAAQMHGIKLQPFIAGDIDEVKAALCEGRLQDSVFAMPGCGRRRRCCERRGNGRGFRSQHT